RTPLNAVIGFSEVLLERMFGDLNERQEDYLRDIRDSGRHLLELINEILDLSKVEAGRMELDPAPLPLVPILEHGVAMVRERAGRSGISLTLEIDPSVGSVMADELKLKQVVLNLLTNAVKFTGAGGSVVVTDDDPLDLELVEAVLAPEGYNVVRASSGEQGVALVRHEQPLVVLLDLMMPDMDGFEVAERLRAEPETADVPIIVLTHKEM